MLFRCLRGIQEKKEPIVQTTFLEFVGASDAHRHGHLFYRHMRRAVTSLVADDSGAVPIGAAPFHCAQGDGAVVKLSPWTVEAAIPIVLS